MTLDLVLLFFLLILSGFFSGAEIALFSTNLEKIHAAKKNATKKSAHRLQALEDLKSDPQKLLVTILIGNNIVNVGASSMATVMAIAFAEQLGARENTSMVVGIVTGVMTFLILLFGEILPKSLAHRHSLAVSVAITPVIQFLQFVFYPVVWPLSRCVQKFSGADEISLALSEEELKAAIDLSEKEGQIDAEEREFFQNILAFDDILVEDIMTPRSKMEAFNSLQSLREVLEAISANHFSRIPVYDEKNEKIIGVVTVHVIISFLAANPGKDAATVLLKDLELREPFELPPSMKISKLKECFHQQKTHMGIVLDEYGGVIGLVTLEDVLEEIFGEIWDENDEVDQGIRRLDNDRFITSAETECDEVEKYLLDAGVIVEGPFFDEEDHHHSLAKFLCVKMGKIPQTGERIVYKELVFVVNRVQENTIKSVRFWKRK